MRWVGYNLQAPSGPFTPIDFCVNRNSERTRELMSHRARGFRMDSVSYRGVMLNIDTVKHRRIIFSPARPPKVNVTRHATGANCEIITHLVEGLTVTH